MEWLQSILDNGAAPALTAFVLGLLTAISPCPLATNIAAIGFIGKNIEDRKAIFKRGIYYTVGRILAYTVLGIILISILKEGASMFGIQKAISKWGELLIGPVLLIIGLYMLFGNKINLPNSDLMAVRKARDLPKKACGERYCSVYSLQWHSAHQAEYSTSVCSFQCQ